MKTWYDRRAEVRKFSVGDQVLALCPLVSSPFQAKYSGPYTVAVYFRPDLPNFNSWA